MVCLRSFESVIEELNGSNLELNSLEFKINTMSYANNEKFGN